MQIKDGRLRFRFNLNNLRTEERDLWLTAITVNDGIWHTVKVSIHHLQFHFNRSVSHAIIHEIQCAGESLRILGYAGTGRRRGPSLQRNVHLRRPPVDAGRQAGRCLRRRQGRVHRRPILRSLRRLPER